MKEKLKKLVDRYGSKELFLLVFYPIFLPLIMLKETSLSVYNIIKALLSYQWSFLSGNDQNNAYNNFFYYIQDYNIQKFGRYGKSNLLAGGHFSLKNWFHTTPFSLRMQASFGTTFIMFFAMCFWLLSWVVLYQGSPNLWILLVVFFSTLFFATFIEIQNYNILGWMLYPIFLIYLRNENYLVLSIVLFLIALSSFTAFFIASILVVISSIYMEDYYLLLCLIPGGIKWVIPVLISMKEGALAKMIGAIGGHEKVKYSRQSDKNINIQKLYLFGMQLAFLIYFILLYRFSIASILLAIVIGLFIINETFVRFADQQSFYLAYLSISVFCLLETNEIDFRLLAIYVLSIYPVYGLMLNVAPRGKSFISPGIRKPFSTEKTIRDLQSLYKDIPEKSKLLIAYKNPDGQYGNIFNGYRIFNEPLQYAATLKNICLLPDWYMVFENNKENDDESFWVSCESDAVNYMKKNDIEYLLVPSFNKFVYEKLHFLGEYEFSTDQHAFYKLELLGLHKDKK